MPQQAPLFNETVPIVPFAEQAPVYDPLTNTPGGEYPAAEAKPFPWMWVGIGVGAAVLVWYFFMRKR